MSLLRTSRIFTLLAPAALACAASVVSGAVPLGEPFSLAVGETETVGDRELTLTFDGVARDNRCPKDVQCIVAGAASVVLTARAADRPEVELTLDVPPGGDAAETFEGYRITVERVDPETVSVRRIEPEEYVVTLRIERP